MEQSVEFPEIISLNIGGKLFTTTLTTLSQIPDTLFTAMFSGRHSLARLSDGSYFIDRDGTHFRWILNFLRDPTSILVLDDKTILNELLAEANFYCMFPFVSAIEHKIQQTSSNVRRVRYICKEDSEAKNVVAMLQSKTLQVKLFNEALLWHDSNLHCDAVLIEGTYVYENHKWLNAFVCAGGTVVVCGRVPYTGSLTFNPPLCGNQTQSSKQFEFSNECIKKPGHPIIAGVNQFTIFGISSEHCDVRYCEIIAEWSSGIPAVVLRASAQGLIIGLNLPLNKDNSSQGNVIKLLQNALSLNKNNPW